MCILAVNEIGKSVYNFFNIKDVKQKPVPIAPPPSNFVFLAPIGANISGGWHSPLLPLGVVLGTPPLCVLYFYPFY